MLRKQLIDEYFYNQPVMTFTDQLKSFEPLKVYRTENKSDTFITAENMYLSKGEFENEYYLETVFCDFEEFLKVNLLCGKKFGVFLEKNPYFGREEFTIEIKENSCFITAGETEGIRRGIIKLEDLLVIGGGNLKKGISQYKPVLERRISRCFFSPINRPPRNLEELGDDVDYYPDGYLKKLMHDGINAIWIGSDYAALIRSPYIKEFGEGSEKRIKKLNNVIEKCARYGISVFLFLIEPMSLFEPTVTNKYPGIFKKYPQVYGNSTAGPTAFCTYTEFGEKYLKDCVERLFTNAPNLAGIISITFGERVTSCANSWPDSEGNWSNNCPHCADKSRSEIVTHTVKLIVDSMKKVKPDAEFISWTYGHRGHPYEMIKEYVEKITDKAIMMQNYEDDGRVIQLKKKRFALDYYLCYDGPSEMFRLTADYASQYNKKLYAKMQVCCSHELATMPYIPVPGLIYDKITGAKKLGVTGVMESWFFGNYPCLMSKSVEMLSYKSGFKNKREFLEKLASLYREENQVQVVADAWEYFEKAYKNYPVNVMFNYYGPMHDGVVWELALKPKNFSLARTWQLTDRPDGDRIGECLFSGHTIDEAITLSEKLVHYWNMGLKKLSLLKEFNSVENEQIAVAEGLGILFRSGLNILKFYKYRNELGYERGDKKSLLLKMKKLVKAEIQNSADMIPLCRAHNCFGYHSEAEGFKFFPEKLEKRIEYLNNLLSTEFLEVGERINNGLCPLEYYQGKEEDIKSYIAGRQGLESALWENFDDGITRFRIAEEQEKIKIEIESDTESDFFVCFEFELMFPTSTFIFCRDGKVKLHRDAKTHQSLLDEKYPEYLSKFESVSLSEKGKTHLIISGEKSKIGFTRFPFKIMIRGFYGGNWCVDPSPVRVLGKCTTSPADFGWVK